MLLVSIDSELYMLIKKANVLWDQILQLYIIQFQKAPKCITLTFHQWQLTANVSNVVKVWILVQSVFKKTNQTGARPCPVIGSDCSVIGAANEVTVWLSASYQVGVQSNSATFLARSKICSDRAPVVPWQSGTADPSVRWSIRLDTSCWCSIGLRTAEAGYLSLSIVLPALFISSLCGGMHRPAGEAVTFAESCCHGGRGAWCAHVGGMCQRGKHMKAWTQGLSSISTSALSA